MIGGITLYALFAQAQVPLVVAMLFPPDGLCCLRASVQVGNCTPLLRRSASALNLSMIAIGVAMKFDTAAMMLFGKESLAVASF